MRRARKAIAASVVAAGFLSGIFLLPVVPISVTYMCAGSASLCAEMSYSTFASPTYAAVHVGAVYVRDNLDGSFSQYCWMNGNPITSPEVNDDSMCRSAVQD